MFTKVKAYYTKLLPQISEDDWKMLSEKFTTQLLKKGDMIVRNGEVCRYVSFINKGLVRIYYIVDGKEINTGFICENEYISEYTSFLTRQPAAQNLDVLEDTELINLTYNDMQLLYKSNPVFEIFGRKIAEYLFILTSMQTTQLLILSPEARYKNLLTQQQHIIQRVPQYMIASYIGITPEHLSRIRKKMSG